MSSVRIVRALDGGAMFAIALTMNRDERLAVAEFLARTRRTRRGAAAAFCADRARDARGRTAHELERLEPEPTTRAFNRRRAPGSPPRGPAPEAELGLRLRRRRLGVRSADRPRRPRFVGSAGGSCSADARSGCLKWTFQANGPVRAAPLAARDGERTCCCSAT